MKNIHGVALLHGCFSRFLIVQTVPNCPKHHLYSVQLLNTKGISEPPSSYMEIKCECKNIGVLVVKNRHGLLSNGP